MLPIFWISLTILFSVLTIHPFVTYPLSLWIVKKLTGPDPSRTDAAAQPRTYSIVFCAYNEEAVLEEKLKNVIEVRDRYGRDVVDILVYNDCSSDRTAEILDAHVADVRGIHGQDRLGKSLGMTRLVGESQADVVIFTDANVMLSPEILPAFAEAFSDPQVGLVCGHLIYTNFNTPTAAVGNSYWQLEEIIKELEAQTGSIMSADGSIFAARRGLYRPVPPEVFDDFFISMSILCDGFRVIRRHDAIAYERTTDVSSEEYHRKIRMGCCAYNCHRLLRPRLRTLSWWNQYKYVSHKLIRWFAAVWFWGAALSACLAIGSIWGTTWGVLAAIFVGTGFGCVRLGKSLGLPLLGEAWEVWLAFLGIVIGVWQSIRGVKIRTWNPVASARKMEVSSGPAESR